VAVHDRDADVDVVWVDRVINHIFASGLTLASVLSRQVVDDDDADHLSDVLDELDAAVRELRNGVFESAVRDRDARLSAVQPETTTSVMPLRPFVTGHPDLIDTRRRLCRFDDDEVFAYVMRGNESFLERDHMLWAPERDGVLVSARSALPFARRVGVFFYDLAARVPLYYERAHGDRRGAQPSHFSTDDAA
jgi:hypothetical protein